IYAGQRNCRGARACRVFKKAITAKQSGRAKPSVAKALLSNLMARLKPCPDEKHTVSRVVQRIRSGECRGLGRSDAGGRSSARGRGAFLPTARSNRRSAEWRRERETWSWGSPWIGR